MTLHRTTPGITGLKTLVDSVGGGRAHIVEFTLPGEVPLGNHGDTLMHRVFEATLPTLGLVPTPSPADADVLLIRPSGALLDRYQAPQMLARRLAALPDLPVIIFPSSSWFETVDPAFMFSGRSSPVLWISREQYSHRHLQKTWGRSLAAAHVELALDHDVVISGRENIPSALGLSGATALNEDPELLLVARLGAEAGSMAVRPATGSAARRTLISVFHRIPPSAQRTVRRRYTRPQQAEANQGMLAKVAAFDAVQQTPLGPVSLDISDPTLASYEQYAQALVRATHLVTDRLHVALPSALLGRPTWLVESGYHKLRGVYEQSLTGLDNLTFVARG